MTTFQWNCVSESIISNLSLYKITSENLDLNEHDGTLCSLKLGPRKPGECCMTCNSTDCNMPHFAHIDLPIYIIINHFESYLNLALKKICIICHQIKACAECKKCVYPNKIAFFKGKEYMKKQNVVFLNDIEYSADELYNIFKNLKQWNMNIHPIHYLTKKILVVPNFMRLSLRNKQNMEITHAKTKSYQAIFLKCKRYEECENDRKKILMITIFNMVNKLMSNKSQPMNNNSNEPELIQILMV